MSRRFDFEEFDALPEFKPWDEGWYPGVILESFTDKSGGKTFRTGDTASSAAPGKELSRNITLCVAAVKDAKDKNAVPMKKLVTINYRPEDLDDERISAVREARKSSQQMGSDMFRSFMTFVRLKSLETILKEELPLNGSGFDLSGLVGKSIDVRVVQDQPKEPCKACGQSVALNTQCPNHNVKIFNSFEQVAPAGTHKATGGKE